MKVMNHVPSISYSDAEPGDACVVLIVSTDPALSQRLLRALIGGGGAARRDEPRAYQLPIAANVAQARSGMGRVAPAVILLDERVTASNLFAKDLQDLAQIAPVVLLAAPENVARWCAQAEVSDLVAQGRVECVLGQGDFVPLAARLIERHAGARREAPGRHGRTSVLTALTNRVDMDPENVPLDFGEVLRHEVNNPLTGILGNAELLLSHRDRISADMVERLEIIADLAIRLRETVRRLSNALERRSARIPAHSPGELSSSHRHRPPT